MTLVISIIFLLFFIYSLLIIYYRQSWISIPDVQKVPPEYQPSTRISVIIPARNEETNIQYCLRSIADQTYPVDLFEVIVVDDFSTDSTVEVVRSFPQPNIRLIRLQDIVGEKINSYKKKAIETALKTATGNLVVTTDADCTMGNNWLMTIAACYEKTKPAFIASPVLIRSTGQPIELFQHLDFMVLQGITGASVHKKIHGMCNGANLAYEKKAFEEVDGFKGIDHIASGDDMLLMHKIAAKYPERISFLKSEEAIVQTLPVGTVKEFFNQRIRWASKADQYKDTTLLPVLLMVYLFNLALLLLPFLAFFFGNIIFCYWIALLLGKTIIELAFLLPVADFFKAKASLWWFPVMQPFHIVYTVIAGWLGKFGKYSWKDRKVK